ncbi:hypothetical protein VTK73DRAFT_7551 [Phialemonium thermophilum]|uniref:Uncharacterized protein n=1 Tax=Phialemonium thermophilum TaxID=223376 RepID=A0ABR3XT96_9PEZI
MARVLSNRRKALRNLWYPCLLKEELVQPAHGLLAAGIPPSFSSSPQPSVPEGPQTRQGFILSRQVESVDACLCVLEYKCQPMWRSNGKPPVGVDLDVMTTGCDHIFFLDPGNAADCLSEEAREKHSIKMRESLAPGPCTRIRHMIPYFLSLSTLMHYHLTVALGISRRSKEE